MPVPAYMKIEGETQGLITEGANSEDSVGNDWQEEHEDEFLVQSFEHNIFVPTNPQSGQPSGQRVHGALVITKVFDKCSPLLYTALVTGERLPECEIRWFRTTNEGTDEHYFTHLLEDAVIISIDAYMPDCQNPALAHKTHLERIAFRYRKITWTHEVGGTEGEDDWRAKVAVA